MKRNPRSQQIKVIPMRPKGRARIYPPQEPLTLPSSGEQPFCQEKEQDPSQREYATPLDSPRKEKDPGVPSILFSTSSPLTWRLL